MFLTHFLKKKYFQDSLTQLNSFMSFFDKYRVEKFLNKFNQDQKTERDKLTEYALKHKVARPVSAHSVSNSNALNNFSNQFQVTPIVTASTIATTTSITNTPNEQSSIHRINKLASNWSINRMKSSENLSQQQNGNAPSFISSLFQSSKSTRENNSYVAYSASHPNNSEFSKTGYLLKKSYHSRVRSWLRRKCQTENGIFLIFHSDVLDLSFLHFNLICRVK